jgi:nucleoside-diphosphate kinase
MAGNLTLALIKPHAHYERKIGKIIERIESEGFAILVAKLTQMLPEGAMDFYVEHKGKPFYANLVRTMSSGPVWALVLSKANAVEEWRKTIGSTDPAKADPGTIRYEFGDHTNLTNNAVHGSSDDWAAKREINFFFENDIKIARAVKDAFDNEPKLNPRRV